MRTDKQIWQEESMFKKYESIPTKLKYRFIEKDLCNMLGKQMANDQMRYMSDDSDSFIFAFENALFEFSKTVKKNLLNKYFEELAFEEWIKLKNSGSYFKYFSGKWFQDKEYFINFVAEKENKKEYINLILE